MKINAPVIITFFATTVLLAAAGAAALYGIGYALLLFVVCAG